jgi:predicted nuclease of predicted toxin-antitoxin system
MLRFLADENFNNNILRGLLRRMPDLDVVRVQDVGLSGADDPAVLEWAAREGRLLLTHDVSTVTRYAYIRVEEGKPMPGVVEVRRSVLAGTAIEDIVLLAECSEEGEWEGQVRYLPLR